MPLPWSDPLPDDSVLLQTGFMRDMPEHPAPERVLLLCCGALVRDAVAALAILGAHHVDVEALPARLHSRPEQILPALRARARVGTARGYGLVAALFGDCGTQGGLAAVCAEEGIALLALPVCAAVYASPLLAPTLAGALVLNDFLLRHFDALLWRPMRLDEHPELVELLFAPDQRLIHLAQAPDPALDALAIRVAVRLNRPVERHDAPASIMAANLAPLVAPPMSGRPVEP
jgi:hypothetical protein